MQSASVHYSGGPAGRSRVLLELRATATGSQYVLDRTARTVKRQMAATPPIVDFLDAGFSRLRKDGETVELLMLESWAVGASAR